MRRARRTIGAAHYTLPFTSDDKGIWCLEEEVASPNQTMRASLVLFHFFVFTLCCSPNFHISANKNSNVLPSHQRRSVFDENGDKMETTKNQNRKPTIRKLKRRVRQSKKLFDVFRDRVVGVKRKGYKFYLEIMARGSSEFECACIKATRPDNEPPKEKYVSSIIAAVVNFDEVVADEGGSKEDFNPYEIALHKIWSRIANKQDWRIKLKALYVMHRLWSSVQDQSNAVLRKQMKVLSKRKCKKTGKPYFSLSEASETSSCPRTHSHYDFLQMYSKYVLYRCKTFSPSFEEGLLCSSDIQADSDGNSISSDLSDTSDHRSKSKNIVNILRKIKKALSIILDHSVLDGKAAVDDITASCYTLLKDDLQSLYLIYEERLLDLITTFEDSAGFRITDLKESITTPQISVIDDDTTNIDNYTFQHLKLCEYYIHLSEGLKEWVTHHNRMFRNFELKSTVIHTERKLIVRRVIDHINSIKQ